MLLKYTLKNIFQKKGRLFIIIFCMTMACFTAFMALDFNNTIQEAMKTISAGYFGSADYVIVYRDNDGVTDELFADCPPVTYIGVKKYNKREITRDETQYKYALTKELTLNSYDNWDTAIKMGLLMKDSVPEKGSITVNKKYAEDYGYEVGDDIVLHNDDGDEFTYKISAVFKETSEVKGEYYGYIVDEDIVDLGAPENYTSAMVDVLDNERRQEFEEIMENNHARATVNPVYLNGAIQDYIQQFTSVVYLVFVMVFLLVIFVTVSFTERIINERMSVIGTLRSIGVSMKKTAFILLFENIMYALIGSALGFGLFYIVKILLYEAMSDGGNAGFVPVHVVLLVVAGAILIQVLIPGIEMLKAVKTSIRDIIFETKDSEYKLSYVRTIMGAVLIVLGLIVGFTVNSLITTMASMVIIVAGVAIFLPLLIRYLSKAGAKLFAKTRMPVAELASTEAGSKKHNFGSAILAVSAILVTAIVFVTSQSLMEAFKSIVYNGDVVVRDCVEKTRKYEYLQEVKSVEGMDYMFVTDAIGAEIGYGDGKVDGFDVVALTNPDNYKGMGDLDPEPLGKYEMIVSPNAARKLGVKEGDSIELTYHINDLFPMKETMTVRQISDKGEFMMAPRIIISVELYKEMYEDAPRTIFITTSEAEKVADEINNYMTNGEKVESVESLIRTQEEDNKTPIIALNSIIVVSIILTLIGISGNQAIAFVSRKKEYAMLHSCALPLSGIIRMILLENAFVFGLAGVVAFIMSFPLVGLASRAFLLADLGLTINIKFAVLLAYIIVLWLITMTTVLSQIKNLKKMNTATELKYE